jgi:hypothetical protein
MKQFETISLLLIINLVSSLIGPFTLVGPVVGFPFILIYSILIYVIGTQSIPTNFAKSLIIIAALSGLSYFTFDLLLVGIIFHSAGIVLGAAVSSYVIAKKRSKNTP